jgi:hypothetical protein
VEEVFTRRKESPPKQPDPQLSTPYPQLGVTSCGVIFQYLVGFLKLFRLLLNSIC